MNQDNPGVPYDSPGSTPCNGLPIMKRKGVPRFPVKPPSYAKSRTSATERDDTGEKIAGR